MATIEKVGFSARRIRKYEVEMEAGPVFLERLTSNAFGWQFHREEPRDRLPRADASARRNESPLN
ncbi:hypothetical protein Pan189_16980 [Stratiformator vulcanicus]|uniref:Uncharacterized protein n=1 Tax=Stratiformator vulcanicus TaxID=2527980 RepID=A0A517R097_9PLAN|nr:hypothetical protein Pan189_16980 [Stratiformator vulcanicus]